MADYLFHFTSRANAQDIIAQGVLRPGRGGRVYLTDDMYQSGAAAAGVLAILGKPIEVACVIPRARIADLRPEGGRHVERLIMDAFEIRPGCGREWYTESEVDVTQLVWIALSFP